MEEVFFEPKCRWRKSKPIWFEVELQKRMKMRESIDLMGIKWIDRVVIQLNLKMEREEIRKVSNRIER